MPTRDEIVTHAALQRLPKVLDQLDATLSDVADRLGMLEQSLDARLQEIADNIAHAARENVAG
jgi:hypothetical protein